MEKMLALLLLFGIAVVQSTKQVDVCRCGYYDVTTDQTFTESIIVYFNETAELSQDIWSVQEYVHKKEKGYTAVYRQGARLENVEIGNDSTVAWLQNEVNPTSLELFVDPATNNHLVVGAEVNSLRQDIRYGSFRARMRSPHPWVGGSALSLMVVFNDTQSLELDMLNTDNANDARLTYLVNGEYPGQQLSTNYSLIKNESTPLISPWDFMDVRIDWIADAVNFTIANNVSRAITSKDREIPTTPSGLVFKHFSTGDANFMQGPPINRSAADVAWVRLFFNSSLMTAEEHGRFDARCSREQTCDMDDFMLRGFSSYPQEALIPYREPARNITLKIPAAIVAAICALSGFITLINALISRGPWTKVAQLSKRGRPESLSEKRAETLTNSASASNTCRPGFSFEPSSNVGEEGLRSGSLYSQSDTDPFESQGPTRRASEAEININLADTKDTKPSILDDMPSRGSVQLHFPMRNNLMEDKMSSLAEHRVSLTERRTSLSERKASIALERKESVADHKASMNGHRPSLSERISNLVERSTLQLTERRASIADRRSSIEEHKTALEEQAMQELATRIATQERRKSSVGDHPRFGRQKSHSIGTLAPEAVEYDAADEPNIENDPKSFDFTATPAKATVPQRGESAKRVLFKIEQPSLTNPDYALRKDKLEQSGDLSVAASKVIAPITSPKKRVDYLAGLVALSCISVTFVHFTLTFIPYVGGLVSGQHYSYEGWARRIAGPYILTPIWIGPFFTTSSRFLAQRYLKEGQLSDIANKMLLRAPRMLIPVIIVAMLEYFLIDQGLTGALQYLPSISWSTWPYVTNYPKFGYYINYMIELAFLIPNAAPQVVAHYCVGVLWTIPVQLQNSYLVLLAVVMVKDIKTPWKRFAFYTFCILNHWYAFSWGACFWLGLVLADMDVTYKWIKWLQARPLVHYPFLVLMWIIAIAAPTFYLIQDRLNYPIMSVEKGWHPDPETGLPMNQTPKAGYPTYYDPRLNTLMFAGALQVIVEVSTWVQWFLSLPLFTWLFPHIMTIYLVHGFIFWSLGAWLCVTLGVMGLPYWANVLVVVVVCYTVLLLVSVLITLVTEKTAQAVCRNTWRWASEEPVSKLTTLFPYPKDRFLNRCKDGRRPSQGREDSLEINMEDKDEHKPHKNKMEKEIEPEFDIIRMKVSDFGSENSLQQEHPDTDQTPRWHAAPPSEAATEPTLTSDDFLDGLPGLVLPEYMEYDKQTSQR
ncbi:hypothetical protein GJ744_009477 [Endocarpon pusillum]|uniref:GH16 domain-containing protein n=1 Tax=Endocarpon pusillum TaxID=364733 RepID=A0A8H7E4E7_9EURO|nr:hypothetical protein GJ744_009477 [Endocarpon pusillum]